MLNTDSCNNHDKAGWRKAYATFRPFPSLTVYFQSKPLGQLIFTGVGKKHNSCVHHAHQSKQSYLVSGMWARVSYTMCRKSRGMLLKPRTCCNQHQGEAAYQKMQTLQIKTFTLQFAQKYFFKNHVQCLWIELSNL